MLYIERGICTFHSASKITPYLRTSIELKVTETGIICWGGPQNCLEIICLLMHVPELEQAA